MLFAFDLVAQGRIMPVYGYRNGRHIKTNWRSCSGERDQLFLNGIAQALPEWGWTDFPQEGQDGALDAAAVVGEALDLFTDRAMKQALRDGTWWSNPGPSEEELRIKKLRDKVVKSGNIAAFVKFLINYGEAAFLD
jgi:hypothetical protein